MENKIFNYHGNNITFLQGNNVMVNATEMAKPFGKLPNEYLRLPSTKMLISAIAGKSRIDENQLVITRRGGLSPGTWMHEDVALDYAQWLSVDFKLWCNDRIKELMKHGFTATQSQLEELSNNPDLLIELAQKLKSERAEKQRLYDQNRLQEQELKKQAPAVKYANTVLDSHAAHNITQIAKEMGMSGNKLNKMLHEEGIQYRQNDSWVLYAKYQDKGYTKTKTIPITSTTGEVITKIHTIWTEKGRRFIHELLNHSLKAV